MSNTPIVTCSGPGLLALVISIILGNLAVIRIGTHGSRDCCLEARFAT